MQWKNLNYSILILFNCLLFSCNSIEKKSTLSENQQVDLNIPDSSLKPSEMALVEEKPASTPAQKKVVKPVKISEYLDNQIKKQEFVIDPQKEVRIKCEKGTEIIIPPDVLVDKNGKKINSKVKLSVKEYYTKSDFVLGNLSTQCGNRIIESGGMLNIEALAGKDTVYLASGANYELKFPNSEQKPGMQLFYGMRNENGQLDWKQSLRKEVDPKIKSNPFWGSEIRSNYCKINLAGLTVENQFKMPHKWKFKDIKGDMYNYFISKEILTKDEAKKYCGTKFIMELTFDLNNQGKAVNIQIEGNPDVNIRNRISNLLKNMPPIDFSSMANYAMQERFYLCFRNVLINETSAMIQALENGDYGKFINYEEIELLVKSNNLTQFNLNEIKAETETFFNKSTFNAQLNAEVPGYFFEERRSRKCDIYPYQVNTTDSINKELTYVSLYPRKFGLINCDRFIEIKGRRYNIEIPVAQEKATVYMVFLQFNSLIQAKKTKSNTYVIDGIPKNTPGVMVVYYQKGDKYFYSSEMIMVESNKYEPTEFKELDKEGLLSELKDL